MRGSPQACRRSVPVRAALHRKAAKTLNPKRDPWLCAQAQCWGDRAGCRCRTLRCRRCWGRALAWCSTVSACCPPAPRCGLLAPNLLAPNLRCCFRGSPARPTASAQVRNARFPRRIWMFMCDLATSRQPSGWRAPPPARAARARLGMGCLLPWSPLEADPSAAAALTDARTAAGLVCSTAGACAEANAVSCRPRAEWSSAMRGLRFSTGAHPCSVLSPAPRHSVFRTSMPTSHVTFPTLPVLRLPAGGGLQVPVPRGDRGAPQCGAVTGKYKITHFPRQRQF